jgi:transposase
MAKRQFTLTDTEEQELREAYNACTDGAQRTRLQAVRLYGSGWAVDTIIEITGCTWRSLSRWSHTYRHAGLDSLADQRSGGNRALLSSEQRTEIQQKLQQYTPDDIFGPEHQSGGAGAYWSVPDLRRAVARWTGVEYQTTQSYRDLFQDCDFSYQRTERQYRSRKAADVAAFSEQLEKK